jgi:predicted amidohydrolase YtcJ
MALINGNVLTMNPTRPKVQAIAVRNKRVTAVGTNAEIKPCIGKNTRLIDLLGRTVLPGFIDTHVHVAGLGRSLASVNLRDADSINELQKGLKEHIQKAPKGRWIVGHGWDQDRFKEKRYPTRWDLDKFSSDNPVVLTRVCGHICVANSKALELANLTARSASPLWGKIDEDVENDEPTGILRESAMDLIWKVMPLPNEEELIEVCSQACQKALSAGLTSVHWIVNSPNEIRAIQKLRKRDRLLLRVYILVPVELLDQLTGLGLCTGFGDEIVRVGSLKILGDGSLGARTAALRKPYSDEPSTKGMLLYDQDELNALVIKAHEAGLQLAIHAIGDQAMEVVLTALENALTKAPRKDHRHRIEHASVLDKEMIRRMKRAKVIASVQPHFIISDFWVVSRVGSKRARWVYPLKSLFRQNVKVAGGSDCPVEPIHPLLGIWAAVARESFPEERLTVDEALSLYTINAAFASFEENIKGSIETGKLADLVILSQDPHEVSPENIKDIEVAMTIVGGKIVYTK